MKLAGKKALITGGNSGIGLATARLFIAEEDPKARAFTAGMLDDKLYLIDTQNGTATPVFDFSTIQAGGWPQLMRVTKDGKRLFVSMNKARVEFAAF